MSDTQFQTIKLRRSTAEVLIESKTILQDGEVCLISTKGDNTYDSFIIGNGHSEAKELGLVPLNVSNGAVFLGLVNPDFQPGQPVSGVFYLASGPGEYHGFGNMKVSLGEVVFFHWANGGWNKLSITPLLVDSELSETSTNPIQNQAVTKRLGELDRLMVKGIVMSGERLTMTNEGIIEIPVDEDFSQESQNPIQNKTVSKKIANLDDWYEL